MTVKWFGAKYPAPMYESCPQVPTPVGRLCVRCLEPIAEGDDGMLYANGPPAHRECYIRSIVGSVAHQQGRCSCYIPGADEEGRMTRREAAKAALEYYERGRS